MLSSPQSLALFNNASLGIIVVNGKGLLNAINPFALKLFGYIAEDVMGKPIEALIPSRYHHKHVTNRNDYINNPRNRPMGIGMDLYAIKKDGTEFPVEVSLSHYNNDGDKNVIAFLSDISIRKKAEAEIIKLNDELEVTVEQRTKDLTETLHQLEVYRDKLEDASAYQKALLDNAGAMIIATDEKGIIKLFNQEAIHNIGYEASEVLNKSTPILFHDNNEIDRKRKELFTTFGVTIADDFAVLVEKSRRKIHEEEEYTYIRKNGTSFPISLTVSAAIDNAGNFTGFMGIAIDISERKKAEEDLQMALEKEKELGELKSRFVSMASHEFRTPLTTVLSSAHLMGQYITTEEQPKRQRHLERIVSSVNMLTDILNDFLSLGKIEEGKIQVRPTEINISDIIKIITDEVKNNLKNKQSIYYQHAGQQNVTLDASLLKHILMNLISNASKFSPEGAPIEIKTFCADHHLSLSVQDHGIGISVEDQKHLTERFFRGTNAGNIQGTGLGLHIVSKYAELMNGVVDYKSELEKGTEFIITFNF
ncbi:MAG: PAS domain S-box protein [Ginsengibacter sp.]